MKKYYLRLGVLVLAMTSLSMNVSCSNDDSAPYKEAEKKGPKEKATVQVEIAAVEEESVSFKIGSKDAEKVYYIIEKKGVAVTADHVIKQGALVADESVLQLVEGLESDQEYVLYALAQNGDGAISFDDKGTAFKTKKALDIRLVLSDIDATHERVIFTVTPTGATRMRYMVVEKSEMQGRTMTAEEVLEEGFSIVKVDGPTTLKPKGKTPNTDYIIYVAGVSASGTMVIVSAEVRTKDESEAPVDAELLQMTNLNFVGDEVGHTVVYYLYMSNEQWEVQFAVGAADAQEDVLKEGRYIRNASQGPGRPAADQVGKSYTILNKTTGTLDTDIDYGEIRIVKTSAIEYKVEVEMVRKSDATKRFKTLFTGVPVSGAPRS